MSMLAIPVQAPVRAPAAPKTPKAERGLMGLLTEMQREEAFRGPAGLPPGHVSTARWDAALYGPLREFLNRPGKGFRPQFVEMMWRLTGGIGDPPEELAIMVEVLHAGSLIVDDIEDGAMTRRGVPALHRVYGTARSLNAANWLYFLPSLMVTRMNLTAEQERCLHRLIASTLSRCHHGQALDVSLKVHELSREEIPDVVEWSTRLKTGGLFEFAATLSALLAGADNDTVEAAARLGSDLGAGLQMLDDLGPIVGDERRNKAHEDLTNGSPTWAWAWLAVSCDEPTFEELQAMAADVSKRRLPAEVLRQRMREHLPVTVREGVSNHLRASLGLFEPYAKSREAVMDMLKVIEKLERSYG